MTNGTRKQIVVSTFAEATFFADGGFDDVIYAVPITLSKMNRVRELTARLESFQFMTDSMEVLNGITKIPPPVGKHWSMLVQLDVGYGRCMLIKQLLTINFSLVIGGICRWSETIEFTCIGNCKRNGEL